MSGTFECSAHHITAPIVSPSISNDRQTELRTRTTTFSSTVRTANRKWNGFLAHNSTPLLATLALIALIPLTILAQSSEAQLRIADEFSLDPEMEMFQRRVERGENFRPLQFGKRDSTFRPLQFGKKSDFRPLQFGKRTPPTMHKKFYGLRDNNNLLNRAIVEEKDRTRLGPASFLAEKVFPPYSNQQRLYNVSPYH